MRRDNLETTGDESVPAWLLVLSLLMSLRCRDVLTKATATAVKSSYERDFAFFETSEGYFNSFVKCKRTLLELKSKEQYSSSKREKDIGRCLFTFLMKREIEQVHVVIACAVTAKKSLPKSVLRLQICCCCCFFKSNQIAF